MNPAQVSAIVLAGGRSSRFGRDKLSEPMGGRTLLEHAIHAVQSVAGETIVVVAPDEPRTVPDGVMLVRDPSSFAGPLVGVLTGLGRALQPVALVVGGDMPTMVTSVLWALIERLDDPAVDVVVLENGGRLQPLPLALRTVPAMAAAEPLVNAGERRLGALVEALGIAIIDEAAWRELDPDGRTFRDVDTPSDLS